MRSWVASHGTFPRQSDLPALARASGNPAPCSHVGSQALEVSRVPSLGCPASQLRCHPVALRICLSAPPPPRARIPPSPHRNFAASPGDWQSAERLTKSTKTNLWGNFPGRKSQFPPRFRNRMGVRLVTDYLLGSQRGMGKNR